MSKKVISKLMGSSKDFSVEERLINGVSVASVLIVLITTVLDTTLGELIPIPFTISMIISLIFSFIYYRSRWKRKSKGAVPLMIITALFAINYYWFFLSGYDGIMPLAVVFATAFFVSVSERKYIPYIIGFISVNLLILHEVSYQFPDLVLEFNSEMTKHVELTFFNLLALILTSVLISFFKRSYETEKDLIQQKNQSLATSEEELKQNAEELKSVNDHLELAKIKAENSSIAKANFLSTMSHEIRTPLNAIIASSYSLKGSNKVDTQDLEKIEIINFASDQLLNLINDILDFSKIDAGELIIQPVEFNLDKFLNQLVGAFNRKAESNEVKLKLLIDKRVCPNVYLDKVRLNQILSNLVDNAIKFSHQKTVTLKVDLLNEEGLTQNIRFEVIDTGIGIREEDIDTIFDVFKQAEDSSDRKFGGTGLGLSITKKLLNLLDSKINVESTFGEGSKFSFELSVKKVLVPLSDSEHKVNNYKGDLTGKKILVVDDNELNIKVAELILLSWGVEVIKADSGTKAIELLASETPHLVLMDLQMPDLDGYESTYLIRQKYSHMLNTPIVALTASATKDVKDRAIKAGLDDFVTKPFIPEKLKSVLQKFLN